MRRFVFVLSLPFSILLLAGGGISVLGCGSSGGEEPAPADAGRAVRVARVEQRMLAEELTVSGLLVATDEAAVGAELAGNRVAEVLVERGDLVAVGQVLVRLDDALVRAQIGQLEANVAQGRAEAADAESRAQRATALERVGAVSPADLEARGFEVERARAGLASARAQLAELRTRLERLTIRAPVSGRIIERNVRTGEIAGVGAPMLRISMDDRIELDAEVPERDLARLRVGGSARVVLPSGETVDGEIRRIDPDVDPIAKLGRARIALAPRQDLRPGGFGRARIAYDTRESAMVPEAALRFSTDGESVLTLDAEGRVRNVLVKTGARSGGAVELIEGPRAGDLVIVGGAAFVLEGDVVEPVFAAEDAEDVAAR